MNDRPSEIKNQLLVMAAQDGDPEAVDELVGRWQERLWRYVFRLTHDDHGAWDITQECWLAILKRIRKLNDPASFRAWAYRIATNKSIDWLKRRNRYREIHVDPMQTDGDPTSDDLQIREIVRRLKETSRVILGLYYFEQLSVGEISEALKIPPGTVKSRLFKARAELKEAWGRLNDNPTGR